MISKREVMKAKEERGNLARHKITPSKLIEFTITSKSESRLEIYDIQRPLLIQTDLPLKGSHSQFRQH
jgi:hypothetical protein